MSSSVPTGSQAHQRTSPGSSTLNRIIFTGHSGTQRWNRGRALCTAQVPAGHGLPLDGDHPAVHIGPLPDVGQRNPQRVGG